MNTLRDTDKHRARPSVWPVYVVAAIVGSVSLQVVAGLFSGLYSYSPVVLPVVLFGFVTIWGLVRLRRWGWWCGAVWTSLAIVGLVGLGLAFLATRRDIGGELFLGFFVFFVGLPGLITIALFVWVLATRRRLFFPPKQEGEE